LLQAPVKTTTNVQSVHPIQTDEQAVLFKLKYYNNDGLVKFKPTIVNNSYLFWLEPKSLILAKLPKSQTDSDLKLRVAAGQWKTVAGGGPGNTDAYTNNSLTDTGVIFYPIEKKKGKITIRIANRLGDIADCRAVLYDKAKNMHEPTYWSNHGGDIFSCESTFDTPQEEIAYFALQARSYETITFKDVSLRPNGKTDVQVESDKSATESVNFEITRSGFMRGDSIEITGITGTSSRLKADETYIITGRYNLASHDRAMLHVYATNGQTYSDQGPDILKGSDEFSRSFRFLEDGWLHLSLYPADRGSAFGNVYFANAGAEAQKHREEITWVPSEYSLDIAPADFRLRYDQKRRTHNLLVSITNNGEVTIPEFKLRYYKGDIADDLNETGHPYRTETDWHNAGPIEPGKTWGERTRDFHLPNGEYDFGVVLDYDNAIDEADESNNTATLNAVIKDGKIAQKAAVQVEVDEQKKFHKTMMSFGPVNEVIINKQLIDLDTGNSFSNDEIGAEDRKEWFKKNGIDLSITYLNSIMKWVDGEVLLGCYDMIVVALKKKEWESITIAKVIERINAGQRVPNRGLPVKSIAGAFSSSTYAIKTREGGIGLLQIVGFDDEPRGINIRYKMVQPPDEPVVTLSVDTSEVKDSDTGVIEVEDPVHDFGKVGFNNYYNCQFKFKNIGQGPLHISKIKSSCGCAVADLDKKTYAPGESGTVKVKYHSPRKEGAVTKYLYILSDDKKHPSTNLVIKATVESKVAVDPEKLVLSLREENAGLDSITLTSKDGRAFSIKKFLVSKNIMTLDFDPALEATKFVLKPKVDLEKLKKTKKGAVIFYLTHPENDQLIVNFAVEASFAVSQQQIYIRNAEPGKIITRDIWVTSKYAEKVNIESVTSKNNFMEVIARQPEADRVKLSIRITPPAPSKGSTYFSDELRIKLNDSEDLIVRCKGWLAK
jgi:hypothetical protein